MLQKSHMDTAACRDNQVAADIADTSVTVPDCNLGGVPVRLASWPTLDSASLSRIVGVQAPGEVAEYADDYDWHFAMVPLHELVDSNPEVSAQADGWLRAYERHSRSDAGRVQAGAAAYAGRQDWLRDNWCPNTAVYPLYVVVGEDGYLLLDGHRRLAGAFFHGLAEVAALVGTPKKPRAGRPPRRRRPIPVPAAKVQSTIE